jgi:hypothetical protein
VTPLVCEFKKGRTRGRGAKREAKGMSGGKWKENTFRARTRRDLGGRRLGRLKRNLKQTEKFENNGER